MLKRFCDRCGRQIKDKWYNIDVFAHEDSRYASIPSILCGCTDIRSTPPRRDYCPDCTADIEAYMQDKKIPGKR